MSNNRPEYAKYSSDEDESEEELLGEKFIGRDRDVNDEEIEKVIVIRNVFFEARVHPLETICTQTGEACLYNKQNNSATQPNGAQGSNYYIYI